MVNNKNRGKKSYLLDGYIFIALFETTSHFCSCVQVWRRKTGLSPPVKYFTDRSKAVLLLWMFLFCLVFAMSRADLLALVCGV